MTVPINVAAVVDTAAFITAMLDDTPNADSDRVYMDILDDLLAAEPVGLVAAFVGITHDLITELAHRTGTTAEQLWAARAEHLTIRLTSRENDHG
ncbi:hypothetical protein AB0F17_63465 [Nonomuraea sp. NPDC026600]|uniref:hypothetical protein n=1 Tax=Nonomuraea sp. NPDC026600 TaxID=3155363 RepID=UPI0033E4ADE9